MELIFSTIDSTIVLCLIQRTLVKRKEGRKEEGGNKGRTAMEWKVEWKNNEASHILFIELEVCLRRILHL